MNFQAEKPGNFTHGSQRYNAKLSEQDVRLIKWLLADGMRQAEIARKFDVSWRCIHDIASGRSWRHVESAA